MVLATVLAVLTALAPAALAPPPTAVSGSVPSVLEQEKVRPAARLDSAFAQRLGLAFAKGDAAALMEDAAPRLDVTVVGEGARYSRSQAAFVLGAFFRDHPPLHVTLAPAGVADGARSLLGVYESENDASFRLDVRLRRRAKGWEVTSVRIDPAKAEAPGGR